MEIKTTESKALTYAIKMYESWITRENERRKLLKIGFGYIQHTPPSTHPFLMHLRLLFIDIISTSWVAQTRERDCVRYKNRHVMKIPVYDGKIIRFEIDFGQKNDWNFLWDFSIHPQSHPKQKVFFLLKKSLKSLV
jgi:hypothetical protein